LQATFDTPEDNRAVRWGEIYAYDAGSLDMKRAVVSSPQTAVFGATAGTVRVANNRFASLAADGITIAPTGAMTGS